MSLKLSANSHPVRISTALRLTPISGNGVFDETRKEAVEKAAKGEAISDKKAEAMMAQGRRRGCQDKKPRRGLGH